MESSHKKLIAGGIVFVGVIAIGVVIYNFVQLYTSMPSRAEVMNFANDAVDALPEGIEGVTGSLVPDQGDSVNVPGNTTLPGDGPTDTEVVPADDWLTPGQRAMLSTLGIDEADLPATLTPALEACFVEKLGRERVDAVKSGETPTVVEGIKAATCL